MDGGLTISKRVFLNGDHGRLSHVHASFRDDWYLNSLG